MIVLGTVLSFRLFAVPFPRIWIFCVCRLLDFFYFLPPWMSSSFLQDRVNYHSHFVNRFSRQVFGQFYGLSPSEFLTFPDCCSKELPGNQCWSVCFLDSTPLFFCPVAVASNCAITTIIVSAVSFQKVSPRRYRNRRILSFSAFAAADLGWLWFWARHYGPLRAS